MPSRGPLALTSCSVCWISEKVSHSIPGKLCRPFSLKGALAAGLERLMRRTQCDHKPTIPRKRIDFCKHLKPMRDLTAKSRRFCTRLAAIYRRTSFGCVVDFHPSDLKT
jgi:hypothetical protein